MSVSKIKCPEIEEVSRVETANLSKGLHMNIESGSPPRLGT